MHPTSSNYMSKSNTYWAEWRNRQQYQDSRQKISHYHHWIQRNANKEIVDMNDIKDQMHQTDIPFMSRRTDIFPSTPGIHHVLYNKNKSINLKQLKSEVSFKPLLWNYKSETRGKLEIHKYVEIKNFFLQYWDLNSRSTPWATPPALHLMVFFCFLR
jgi:hypothetical protein